VRTQSLVGRILMTVGCLLRLPGSLIAQSTGAIEGRAVSDLGAPLFAAEITVSTSNGDLVRRVESDRSGGFRIGFLDPGSYLLATRRIGYRAAVPILLSLQAGETVWVTLAMDPVPLALDSLVVSAPVPAILCPG
jgi:Carboxypeptidase regulatory-like domain